MAGNLLSIGKSGLFAAQTALSTTGHNIANANVAGYSRQGVTQSAGLAQNLGYGFVGSGTQVADIKRYSDSFLNTQVRSAQAAASAFDGFQGEIAQIDNMLADASSGLSPMLQDFFAGVQNLAASGGSVPARQALLSSADSLASRFQGLNTRMEEIREGVNAKITSNITLINSYADQIADLNQRIVGASGGGGSTIGMPNDLLDQRDQLVLELNKHVKATVTKTETNSYTVSIGSGQPLVVGAKAFELAATRSPTDLSRVEVGYATASKVNILSAAALSGGELGGLLDFRANSLDRAQNALGRIAIGFAASFNAQHQLGRDSDNVAGTAFFQQAQPQVTKDATGAVPSSSALTATIVDAGALSTSDYKVSYDGSAYSVLRLSDQKPFAITPGVPTTIDGVEFTLSGTAIRGDNFLVKPTINGATDFKVLLTDGSKIAARAPIATEMPLTNTGTGKVSPGSVTKDFASSGMTLPVTLQYNSAAGGTVSGFPATQSVAVTLNGNVTPYAAGATVPFVAGATYSFGGVNVVLSGQPNNTDKFTVTTNSSGAGDTRNAALLGELQTTKVFGGSATYQSAYSELVSFVGNKTREMQVNGAASATLLAQATSSQQAVAGVNLDEEAANLVRYQQAYQASGKVMQIASTLFDTLLSLGR
ncbi:MAG TPA: flagellar hook-associated protein FlgK [Telluria sp.]